MAKGCRFKFAVDCYIAYDNSKQLKSESGDSLFWQKDEQKDEGDSARVTQKSEKKYCLSDSTNNNFVYFKRRGRKGFTLTRRRRQYQPGAASRRDIGAKHRLNFDF